MEKSRAAFDWKQMLVAVAVPFVEIEAMVLRIRYHRTRIVNSVTPHQTIHERCVRHIVLLEYMYTVHDHICRH